MIEAASATATIKRPLGVTVIAVLYLLQGTLLSVLGVLLLLKSFIRPAAEFGALDGVAIAVIGALLLLLGRGLWRLRSWARKTALWLNGIGIVLSLFRFSPGSVISILVAGSILLYLGRSSMLGYFD